MTDQTHSSEESLQLQIDFPYPSKEEWRKEVDPLLKGAPYEKVMITKTYEGIDLQPIYCQEDIKDLPHLDEMPGFAPYVRGTDAINRVENGWFISQAIPYADPSSFNQAISYDLQKGQNAVRLTLDKPSYQGIDPDQCPEKVGIEGTSISNLQDLQTALHSIDIVKTRVDIEAYSNALTFLSMFRAHCQKANIAIEKVQGSVSCDPLSELAANGTINKSICHAYKEMSTMTKWATKNAPAIKTIGVNSAIWQNAGGSAVEELGYGFATAIEYIKSMLTHNLTIEEIAPAFTMTLSVSSHLFIELAKFRAARMLWAKIVKEFGGDKEAQKLFIHGKTSVYNKTKFDPYVNMLRTTTEAFSAIVGGCDSLHIGPFDEIIRKPDEFSRRIARNQQLLLKEESHFQQVIDPAGGSWYVEALTAELVKNAWKLIQDIDGMGGMYQALKQGVPQKKVTEINDKRRKNVATRKDVVIGTNMYPNLLENLLVNQENEKAQCAELVAKASTKRKNKELNISCDSPDLIDSVTKMLADGFTIGEITKACLSQNKEQIDRLHFNRVSENFEQLRMKVMAYTEKQNKPVSVFFANIGTVSQLKARLEFSRGFLEVAGLAVNSTNFYATVEEALVAAAENDAEIITLCSTDDQYPMIVPEFSEKLKALCPQKAIILAGYPKDHIDSFTKAGIDFFLYMKADVYETLTNVLSKIGVIHE